MKADLTCRLPFWKGVGDSQELSLKVSPVPPNCAPPPGNVTDEKDIILSPHRTLSTFPSSSTHCSSRTRIISARSQICSFAPRTSNVGLFTDSVPSPIRFRTWEAGSLTLTGSSLLPLLLSLSLLISAVRSGE